MDAVPRAFSRWLIAALAMTLIVLLAGGAWLYLAEQTAGRQQAEKELAAIAQLKIDQIVNWRGERVADAALLMESPFLAKTVARFFAGPDGEAAAKPR